jgi:hypothetical protein
MRRGAVQEGTERLNLAGWKTSVEKQVVKASFKNRMADVCFDPAGAKARCFMTLFRHPFDFAQGRLEVMP